MFGRKITNHAAAETFDLLYFEDSSLIQALIGVERLTGCILGSLPDVVD
jgi:hypothetical protein